MTEGRRAARSCRPDSARRVHTGEGLASGLSLSAAAIAARTDEFSGADLAHLCESAAQVAMEDSLRTGHIRPIRTDDLRGALKEIRPSTRPWFEIAKNFAMFANEGGLYDDLLAYIRAHRI